MFSVEFIRPTGCIKSEMRQVVSSLPPTSSKFTILKDPRILVCWVGSISQHLSLQVDSHKGTVVALYDIGCFVGACIAVWLGEVLGRKKSVLVGTTIMTIGAIIQVASYSVGHMIAGRIIAGIGNGINTATAPVWQTETSQIKWRGKLVVIELILNIGGFSISNWVTYGFSFTQGPISWRFPLAFQLIFIIVLFSTVPWLPESPRYASVAAPDGTSLLM